MLQVFINEIISFAFCARCLIQVSHFIIDRLSKPKHLHGGIRFLDAIPKSLTGKILRRVLRDMAKHPKSKL